MTKTFVISDTHFGHRNIITFTNSDGSPLRPFQSVEEMDEALVANWNSVVSPEDRVYHLGDVVINRKALPILDRLNGRKCLIKGNHDIFKLKDYLPYFDDIRSYKVMPKEGIIMSHIPIHPASLARWRLNVHGHLHGNTLGDPRYLNVSVEQINFTPLDLQVIIDNLNKDKGE